MLFPNKWKLIDLPKITDSRGSLTFIEGNFRHLPFDIKRIYYLYDVPNTQIRGEHGHKNLQQLMIAQESFQEVWKEKLEFGRSEDKLKLWKLL